MPYVTVLQENGVTRRGRLRWRFVARVPLHAFVFDLYHHHTVGGLDESPGRVLRALRASGAYFGGGGAGVAYAYVAGRA